MEELLFKLFKEASAIFLEEESDNILNDVAERNLCGRLAIYLTVKLEEYGINGYYADPEYNRKQNGQVKTILDEEMNVVSIQCDLIVHSRGRNIIQDNLIAVEMKKSNRPEEEKESDRKRVRTLTKSSYDDVWSADGVTLPEHVCGYIWGVYMEINRDRRTCLYEYYMKGNLVNAKTSYF